MIPEEVKEYLQNEAYRYIMTKQWIDKYKEMLYKREIMRTGRLFTIPPHPHASSPYCSFFDVEFEAGDEVYVFLLGNGSQHAYHKKCVESRWGTQKLMNIVSQDRANRRRRQRPP